MFKLPFSILPQKIVYKLSDKFIATARKIEGKRKDIKLYLEQADLLIKSDRFVALCVTSLIFNFIFLTLLFIVLSVGLHTKIWYAPLVSIPITFIIYFEQLNYPKLISLRRTYNVEKNLLPALRALLIQLNAGITFFDALKNIAKADYGLISQEFQKAVTAMESGVPAIDALEVISRNNPSIFFRRAVWQIITGMQVGSEINNVLKEIVGSLLTEQLTEIQAYGGKLAPTSMFYMVIAVIFPALSVTFIIILSSFLPVFTTSYKTLLFVIIGAVLFLQLIFLGIIKTRRPTLI